MKILLVSLLIYCTSIPTGTQSLKNRVSVDLTDHCTSDAQNSAWFLEGDGYFRTKEKFLKWEVENKRKQVLSCKDQKTNSKRMGLGGGARRSTQMLRH